MAEHTPDHYGTIATNVIARVALRSKLLLGFLRGRYTRGVGGSNPSPLTISWNEPVGLVECPYIIRWVMLTPWFSIRLHRWLASDDVRAVHDHSWWFIVLVLRGCYLDAGPGGTDILRRGSIRFRPAIHQHSVVVLKRNTWTILLTGPVRRRWGFWVCGRLVKRDKYFAVHGHHACDTPGSPPVRIAPNRTRI